MVLLHHVDPCCIVRIMPPRKAPLPNTPIRHSSRTKRAPSHADDDIELEQPASKRMKAERCESRGMCMMGMVRGAGGGVLCAVCVNGG